MTAAVMDLAPLIVWAAALSTILNLGVTVVNLLTNGARANTRAIEDHRSRIERLEFEVKEMPKAADLHDLKTSVTQMSGALTKIEAIMERVEGIVTRHQTFLMERK